MRKQRYYSKQYKQRTVPKKKRKFFGAVLLLIILLPYVCTAFTGSVHTYEEKIYHSPIIIVRKTDMGTERIPMEEYLVGALAASMEPTCEPEALKAQAVILRTMVYKQYQSRNNKSKDAVDIEMLQQEYMPRRLMKQRFGENYELYYRKFCSAVEETEGCIVQYENIAVDTPYFLLSNGKTRNGNEAFGSAKYPYLQSAESSADIMSPDYLCKYSYDKNQFQEKLTELLHTYEKEYGSDTDVTNSKSVTYEPAEMESVSGNHGISENSSVSESSSISENSSISNHDSIPEADNSISAIRISDIILERDSSGYVLTLQINGKNVSGEFFRSFLGLNSACFTIEEKGSAVEIVTKGIGHGVGMSQYGANEMAKGGKDFVAILQHYFTNIQIERN